MKKYSTVVLNGRFLEQKITGVQRFALENIKEIDKMIEPEDNFILAVPPDADLSPLSEIKNIKIKKFGHNKGILWEQTSLPHFIHKNKGLGVHFCNTVPLFNKKSLVTIHDITYKIHPEFNTTKKTKLMAIYHNILNKAAIKNAIKLFTVSENSKKEIVNTYKINPDKVKVIYNGWQHFNTKIQDENALSKYPFLKAKNYYYSMSTIAKNKNFPWIIKAASNNPDSVFAVAGSSDLKKLGENINSNLKNVHYLGYVSDDDAKVLLKNCKAFIFPSIFEGFGIPPLEALAMGSPVICSFSSCLKEIYMDCVHYIDPENADVDLDKLLKEKVADPSKVLDFYSWKKTATGILDEIRKLK